MRAGAPEAALAPVRAEGAAATGACVLGSLGPLTAVGDVVVGVVSFATGLGGGFLGVGLGLGTGRGLGSGLGSGGGGGGGGGSGSMTYGGGAGSGACGCTGAEASGAVATGSFTATGAASIRATWIGVISGGVVGCMPK